MSDRTCFLCRRSLLPANLDEFCVSCNSLLKSAYDHGYQDARALFVKPWKPNVDQYQGSSTPIPRRRERKKNCPEDVQP